MSLTLTPNFVNPRVSGAVQRLNARPFRGPTRVAVPPRPLGAFGAVLHAYHRRQFSGLGTLGISATDTEAVKGIGAAAATYGAIENFQSGATASDALSGAEAGAAIGELATPVGAAVGAIIGLAVGAVASAFGGGKADPETMALDNYVPVFNNNPAIAASLTPAQNFQLFAGVFDAKNNSPNHSTPLEQVFGREGEGNFVNKMLTQINSAITAGQVPVNANAIAIYTNVVDPWLASIKGHFGCCTTAQIESKWTTAKGNQFGDALTAAVIYFIFQWQQGKVTPRLPLGIAGQEDTHIPPYAGNLNATPAAATTSTPTTAGAPAAAPSTAAAAPPAATPALSPNNAAIAAGSGGSLVTAQGTWTFGTATDANGDAEILLNGGFSGQYGTQLAILNGTPVALYSDGSTYGWGGSSWSQLTPAASSLSTSSVPAGTTSYVSAPAAAPVSAAPAVMAPIPVSGGIPSSTILIGVGVLAIILLTRSGAPSGGSGGRHP